MKGIKFYLFEGYKTIVCLYNHDNDVRCETGTFNSIFNAELPGQAVIYIQSMFRKLYHIFYSCTIKSQK